MTIAGELGGLYGLLLGDAVGVPYEFHSPETLPPFDEIDIVPPRDFRRSHPGAPLGAWSDDGAQALCLLESLLQRGELHLGDFATQLGLWLDVGHLAVEKIVFDVGIQTQRALGKLRQGVSPECSGGAGERDNGNGSLMRVLPLALWHKGTDAELAANACQQSLVTHAHPRSQAACALYCLWAREVLKNIDGISESYDSAFQRALELPIADSLKQELCAHFSPDVEPTGHGSGYVVDCLNSARIACRESSYERVIRRAISFGNDTDTTATVAGGIAGIRYGVPEHWLSELAGRDIVDPLARRLLQHLSS